LYDVLAEWAHDHHLNCETHDRPNGYGPGRDRKLTISGTISADFRDTLPKLVVEWGDGYRADFTHGLPAPALIGLVAGFLGVSVEKPPKEAGQ
jgi:hypothetical protein